MALKRHLPEVRFNAVKVTPDEMDIVRQYTVVHPSVSPTWFGTTAVGTAGQSKALVLINRIADYPRNLAGAVAGSAGLGGTWVVNGKDQFGNTIQESVTIGTATNGGTTEGTKVFAQLTSGTFNFATASAAGNGTPRLGVGIAETTHLFGLPDKIAGTGDVKAIAWINNGTSTTVNGGTVGAYVGTANHTFKGTAAISVTDTLVVRYRSSFNSEADQVHSL